MKSYNYDKIRPYRDNEVNGALMEIVRDPDFLYIVNKIYGPIQTQIIIDELKKVRTVYEFQSKFTINYAELIERQTIKELTFSGLENIDKTKNYLFISNHRDIILDSALLNTILHRNHFPVTEIAIGSNLLIFDWIRHLVRLNRSFIVRRDLKGKDMLDGSHELSAYIRDTITKNKTSVWIAQREGRTKDGNDKTQVGLLKMFNFSGEGSFAHNFKELNIIPVSISYEYEPCASAKTFEINTVRKGEKYQKTTEDDLNSMGRGLYDNKGRVHFNFSKISDSEIDEIGNIKNVNERYLGLSGLIDKKIYDGYKLFENNFIAHDLLNNTNRYKEKYNELQKKEFEEFVNKNVCGIEGDRNTVNGIFYEIFAKPVCNKIEN